MRLKSLDVLRGLDLWFLLMVGPLYRSFYSCCRPDSPFLHWLKVQMNHVKWEGFVAWDIIMPLFMFMSGITIPFSMAKYKNALAPDRNFYLKLLRRFVLLFVFGWLVQGNLLTFDPKLFHPFANTLQTIAVGYAASALMFVYLRPKGQIILTVSLFLAYLAAFVFTGMNLDPESNIAMTIDKAVLGAHRDGVMWTEDGSWTFNPKYQYTWVLSSLNFIVTVMMGCFAGQILCARNREVMARKAIVLAGVGAALVIAGLAMSPWFPIIKKIWSSSMTLFSGGICFLLMALTYYLVDVRKSKLELKGIACFGLNSIVVYVIGEMVNFSSVSQSFLYGLEPLVGKFYPLVITFGNVLILYFIMRLMYKYKVFVKI